ncbi:MAG: hypothetical protein JWM59_4852 [Verrucomicrobiales bacterium]|nr:hypothetical protein [Verrucomicrobiales bacterium]
MKILFSLLPLSILLTVAFTPSAQAHHGQEFFLLNDAKVQSPGSGLIQSTFSFSDEGYADSLRLTSGIIIGVLPRTAISVIGDFSQEEGENWSYRSIEPSLLFDLTPKNFRLPVRFGVSFGYQFAEGGNEVLEHSLGVTAVSGETMEHSHTESESETHTHSSGSGTGLGGSSTEPHDHSTHDHGTAGGTGGNGATTTPPTLPGGENNPDALTPDEIAAMNGGGTSTPATPAPAPAPSTTAATKSKSSSNPTPKTSSKSASTAYDHADAADAHAHSHSHENSIHNHDDNLFTSRFTFEADLTQSTLLVGNLICVVPEGGSAAWGYGVGLRQRLRPGLSVGVEALGDFDRHGYQEALGAVYWEPMHHLILKVGAGTGLSATSPDATVRAGLLWMF